MVFNNAGVPPNDLYAPARYLVMVSRRFYGKKHYSPNSVCLRGSNDVSVPGANVGRFSGLVPVSVFVVLGTRFMRTRGTW